MIRVKEEVGDDVTDVAIGHEPLDRSPSAAVDVLPADSSSLALLAEAVDAMNENTSTEKTSKKVRISEISDSLLSLIVNRWRLTSVCNHRWMRDLLSLPDFKLYANEVMTDLPYIIKPWELDAMIDGSQCIKLGFSSALSEDFTVLVTQHCRPSTFSMLH